MEIFGVTENNAGTLSILSFINFKKIGRSSNWSRL